MLTLVPFRRFESVFDVPSRLGLFGQLFDELDKVECGERKALMPEFDLSETEEQIILKADIAGIDIKDLDINIKDNMLVIKGERKEEQEEKMPATTRSRGGLEASRVLLHCRAT